MKRILTIAVALAVLSLAAPADAARPRFQVRCFSSHVAQVDPIVAPGEISDHEHEFFGNRSTNAFSTYASMIAAATNCSTVSDTAAYWTPTVFSPSGQMVRAQSLLIYYRGANGERTHAFPADLRIISDDFRIGPDTSNLLVKFPECWDGFRLDSPDHRSHMAFATGKGCPATHPVRVPEVTEVFRYPVANLSNYTLSSGPSTTGHADFWNTWDQAALESIVARCLQAGQCPRIDG